MTSTFYTINLSESNDDLVALKGIPYPKNFVSIPNGSLVGELNWFLYQAYQAVKGATVSQEAFNEKSSISVKSNKGAFERIYSPTLYQQNGGLVIKWGDEVFPLALQKGSLVMANPSTHPSEPRQPVGGFDVECDFEDMAALRGGQGATDLTMMLNFVTPEVPEGAFMLIRCHLVDLKTKAATLRTSLKRGKLADVLSVFTDLDSMGKGGNDFEGETISMGELPGTGSYKVTAYRAAGAYGRYILQVMPPTPEEIEESKYSTPLDAPLQVWCNDTIASLLNASPVVTPDKPARLIVHSIVPGKTKGFKVNCGFIVHQNEEAPKTQGAINMDFFRNFK